MVHNKYSKERETEIVNMYLNGKSQKEIADYFGTYNTTIRRILIRNNIRLRSNKELSNRLVKNPFSDDNISMYYLGLLIADGNIYGNRVTLGFKSIDLDELIKFKLFIGVDNDIKEYTKKGTSFKFVEYKFRNDMVCEWLMSKAIFVDKSNKADIHVPFTSDVVRGLFDGDGCIFPISDNVAIINFAIKSNILANKLNKYLLSNNIDSKIYINNNINYVTTNTIQSTNNLIKFMYQNIGPSFERKKVVARLYSDVEI